ncbi:Solute carrier family 22 member 1 [Eumeta japonica]|uniref:Solute carrier family 22 member 1 n=1 Tax=Eumeta variegata TaxID=151549 RepID=A0A4C1ZUM2_EUMVA|nr:Solute carrier family 22 member 1 [Eumeta japonica]
MPIKLSLCKIPECESSDSTLHRPFWRENGTDECRRPVLDRQKYELRNGTCSEDTFTNQTEECTRWVYESQDTIVTEMNLACNPWKVAMVGVMHNLGMLVSMVFVGWLTDRYGRKPVLIICSAGSCIGIVRSFLNSYYWFIAMEFLESFIGGGLYSVGSVLRNKYTNFIISALMSFPGEMMSYFFMSYYGRKYPLIIGFVVCGTLCIGLAFAPDSLPWLQIALFTLGKLLMAMCFTGVCTYTLEMFPTSTRGTVIGICSLFIKIGSLLSPLTPLLNFIMPELFSLLCGASAILAGALLILTPETKGVPLPDTIEQVEAQIRNK